MRWSSKWWVGERASEREGKLEMRCRKPVQIRWYEVQGENQIPVWQTMMVMVQLKGGGNKIAHSQASWLITGKMGLRHDAILAIVEWWYSDTVAPPVKLILVSTSSIHFNFWIYRKAVQITSPAFGSCKSQGATKWARLGHKPDRLWVSSRIIIVNLINAGLD